MTVIKNSNRNSILTMLSKAKMPIYEKILAYMVLPFIVIYMLICGFIQLFFYPILYVILTLLYDKELRSDVSYRIRKVWSIDYWT